ncbi:MAG: hypothetical protein R6V40_02585 [Candidatus Moraniibacteriota bacterium]
MDPETKKRLDDQDKLLKEIYFSVEKTRQYFLWTLIISVAAIVLPLIGLAIVIPKVISIYSSALGGF